MWDFAVAIHSPIQRYQIVVAALIPAQQQLPSLQVIQDANVVSQSLPPPNANQMLDIQSDEMIKHKTR